MLLTANKLEFCSSVSGFTCFVCIGFTTCYRFVRSVANYHKPVGIDAILALKIVCNRLGSLFRKGNIRSFASYIICVAFYTYLNIGKRLGNLRKLEVNDGFGIFVQGKFS